MKLTKERLKELKTTVTLLWEIAFISQPTYGDLLTVLQEAIDRVDKESLTTELLQNPQQLNSDDVGAVELVALISKHYSTIINAMKLQRSKPLIMTLCGCFDDCPTCGKHINKYGRILPEFMPNYCSNCGQKILKEWSEQNADN